MVSCNAKLLQAVLSRLRLREFGSTAVSAADAAASASCPQKRGAPDPADDSVWATATAAFRFPRISFLAYDASFTESKKPSAVC